jgi:hypothetical protein
VEEVLGDAQRDVDGLPGPDREEPGRLVVPGEDDADQLVAQEVV